jgi:hypothetical protein
MKRKGVSLRNQDKWLQTETALFKFQILGIYQFIWSLDYRTFGALACTSKRASKCLSLSHEYNRVPKHRAIRLAWKYRKLYDQEISQNDYDVFARSMFTEQEFIDYQLDVLVSSDRKTYVSAIINASESKRNRSLLECFNQFEDITKRLDSLKETKFPVSQFMMKSPHQSFYLEFAFQGGSLFHLGRIYAIERLYGPSFSPVFSTWKSLDEINLNCLKELQKEIQIPLPMKWINGHEMITRIYNQPGFAVLSSIVSWRGNFLDFVEYCHIDYTEQDFANLGLNVNSFLFLHPNHYREPPLWVWQRLFPNRNLTNVPRHLRTVIVPGGEVDKYFN